MFKYILFSNRHIPATQKIYHAKDHCMMVQPSLVATLLGNSVNHFYVDSLFETADPARMLDSFLQYL